MKTIIAVLALALNSYAITVTAAGSGLWSDTSTWTGGVVPGSGDKVIIPDTMTVTVTSACGGGTCIIGNSPAAGVAVISLNNSGSIVVASGGYLKVRGDIGYTLSVATPGITVQAGGIFEWDASGNALQHYSYKPNIGYDFAHPNRQFLTTGTSVSHATVQSNINGAAGYFSNLAAGGGNYASTYTDFIRIGDGTQAGWQFDPRDLIPNVWNFSHNTFTACGYVDFFQTGLNATGMIFSHTFNVHSGSLGGEIFHNMMVLNNIVGVGTRLIQANVFDVSMSASAFYPAGHTIIGNYFSVNFTTSGPGATTDAWTQFSGNFLRATGSNVGPVITAMGPITNSYIFVDSDAGNPHVIQNSNFVLNCDAIGNTFGQSGDNSGPPAADSGEFSILTNPAAAGLCNITGNVLLPNMSGYSALEIGSVLGSNTTAHWAVRHNTWFGGAASINYSNSGVNVSENGLSTAGQLNGIQSNVFFNVGSPSTPAAWYKNYDLSANAGTTVDVVSPANADYNAGFGPGYSLGTGYTNSGRGYNAKFSSTPGAHDQDVDPKFLDYQRNMELFDSKYLKNSPATWQVGSTYSVNNTVQLANSGQYWGLPINYRYINASGCGATNPRPGSGTNWRLCWEWATLQTLRSVASGTTFTDGALVVPGDTLCTAGAVLNPIDALTCWVRRGFVSTSPTLWGAGHDNNASGNKSDIGAISGVNRIGHAQGITAP